MDLLLKALEKEIENLESLVQIRKRIESGDLSHLVRELHTLESQKQSLQKTCTYALEKTERIIQKINILLGENEKNSNLH